MKKSDERSFCCCLMLFNNWPNIGMLNNGSKLAANACCCWRSILRFEVDDVDDEFGEFGRLIFVVVMVVVVPFCSLGCFGSAFILIWLFEICLVLLLVFWLSCWGSIVLSDEVESVLEN
jgi:hypothetical protein